MQSFVSLQERRLARESRVTNCIAAGGRPCGLRYIARLGRWVVSRDRSDTT